MTDIATISRILESEGVFEQATLLAPEVIVNIALSLARTPNPNTFREWLTFYAARYGVTTTDLTIDAFIVLSHSAEFVGAEIANAAKTQAREMRLRELVETTAA